MGVEIQAATRESSQIVQDYALWFGTFLSELPDDPNAFDAYCKAQQVPYGLRNVRFENPQEAAQLLREGYIPSPSPFEVVNEGNVATWIVDTWRNPARSRGEMPKSTKQKEVETTLNERFGIDNWKLALLDTVTDNSPAMATPMVSLVFLKKSVAEERYNLANRFSRYPSILAKLR